MTQEFLTKRDSILRAALKLFTDHGFHGTPTSKIAKEAGVATGTLFHHFATKEELINTLYITIKENLKDRLSLEIAEETTIRGKLHKMWLNIVQWSLDCPEEQLFFNQFSNSPYITNVTREEGMKHFQFYFQLIDEGQKQEILKMIPQDLLLNIGHGVIMATAQYFSQHPDRFEDESHREIAFNVFWDCVRR